MDFFLFDVHSTKRLPPISRILNVLEYTINRNESYTIPLRILRPAAPSPPLFMLPQDALPLQLFFVLR